MDVPPGRHATSPGALPDASSAGSVCQVAAAFIEHRAPSRQEPPSPFKGHPDNPHGGRTPCSPAPEADRAALADAMEFLRAALAGGERPATEVLHEATALG